jgi:hypothetical protein
MANWSQSGPTCLGHVHTVTSSEYGPGSPVVKAAQPEGMDTNAHAGRVDVPATFARPNPVRVTVRSNLSRGEVLDRLERALGGYYETESHDPRYLGLDGSVAGDHVILIARPFSRPGERQARGMLPITLRGEVVSTPYGAELQATATSTVGRAGPTLLAVALMGLILVGISGGQFITLFALLGGALIAAAWTLIIRDNQRSSLRRVDTMAGILETILDDP